MNNTFCIIPWLHLHSMPNGNVFPCCHWRRDQSIGNAYSQSIDEIANSEIMSKLRADMLAGVEITGCQFCTANGKEYGSIQTNPRHMINEFYKKNIDALVSNTTMDGKLQSKFRMQYLHVRYSNLCNNACRSCDNESSSVIAKESGDSMPIKRLTNFGQEFVDQVAEHLPYVNLVSFAGGESVIIDEHWDVLDKLYKIKNRDVKILFPTNLSKLTYKRRNLISYCNKFRNFLLIASLDASHERAELYRSGTNWNTIEKNLRLLRENGIRVEVNCTISASNIWHAPDLEKYLIQGNFIETGCFHLTLLMFPSHMCAQVLPKKFRDIVSEKIEEHISWLQGNRILHDQWRDAIRFMNFKDAKQLLADFVKFNEDLDKKRKQDFFKVFPELKNIL